MPKVDEVYNKNIPQAPADTHDTRYWNDARGWVRGTTGSAEPTCHDETGMDKPGAFDKSNSWRRPDRGHCLNDKPGKKDGNL